MSVREKQGYSLIEVLIVLAIISMLAGMMLPGIWASKQNALQAKCASNLRQLGIAFFMYAQDHQMYLPADTKWDELIYPYLQKDKAAGDLSEVMLCPVYVNNHYNFTLTVNPIESAYAMSKNWATAAELGYHKMVYHRHFDNTILLAPVIRLGEAIPEEMSCVPREVPPYTGNADLERHKGNRSNYLFIDGHVKPFTLEQTIAADMWYAN